MIMKPREMTAELLMLDALHNRMTLPPQDRKNYVHLQKGYEGEQQFDHLLGGLECDHIQLHDLLLEYSGTVFQIDTLLITKEKIFVYEVKNYQGEFFFEQEKFMKYPHQEIMNPLHQIGRSAPMLTQLLRKLGFNLPIQFHIVFINLEFTLYHADKNPTIILPTQLNQHLRLLHEITTRLSQNHHRLAEKLVELHLEKSPYQKRPEYTYDEIRKGIVCGGCGLMEVELKGRKYYCAYCNWTEQVSTVITSSIKEFQLLFPEKKVTVSTIGDWCGGTVSLKTISRVLNQNFTRKGKMRWSYYE